MARQRETDFRFASVAGLACVFLAAPMTQTVAPAAAIESASYVCTFQPTQVWTATDGEGEGFKSVAGGALSFRISGVTPGGTGATVDGSGPLKVVEALDARHFIEVNVAGYLNLTTIYEQTAADGAQLAVHSRHSGVAGRPVISQYHGTCKIE